MKRKSGLNTWNKFLGFFTLYCNDALFFLFNTDEVVEGVTIEAIQ